MLAAGLSLLIALLLCPLIKFRNPRILLILGAAASAMSFFWILRSPESKLVWDLLPSLGIQWTFELDSWSKTLSLLITGIGACVWFFAAFYFSSQSKGLQSFFVALMTFELAMLGLSLAQDLICFFVFWELTSLTSFLLIGFKNEKPEIAETARRIFIFTAAGGLILLVGILLLPSMQIATLGLMKDQISTWAIVFIFVGAATKSALFPFSFWLPQAMAAPTPVSSYLHSAAMVKAGLILMSKLHPTFSSFEVWVHLLWFSGLVTFLYGIAASFFETDLKRILAWSTVANLGLLAFILGVGGPSAMILFQLVFVSHALYKAALFQGAGIIDLTMGSRDIRHVQLKGVKELLPLGIVLALVLVSALGMFGTYGAISKEYLIGIGFTDGGSLIGWILMVSLGLLSTALLRASLWVFLRKGEANLKPMEVSKNIFVAPLILALAGFLPMLLVDAPSSPPSADFSWPKWMSLVLGLVVFGVLLKFSWTPERKLPSPVSALFELFFSTLSFVGGIAKKMILPRFSILVLGVGAAVFVALSVLPILPTMNFSGGDVSQAYFLVLLLVLMGATTVGVAVFDRPLHQILLLSVLGFCLSIAFGVWSAPDVALTQLLCEALIAVILIAVFRNARTLKDTEAPKRMALAVATVFSIGIFLVLISLDQAPRSLQLPTFFQQNAYSAAFGRNIVNVILVDFRALDTYNEILVCLLAALGFSALGSWEKIQMKPQVFGLKLALRTLSLGGVALAAFLLFRGHYQPGGGFIAALVLSLLGLLWFVVGHRIPLLIKLPTWLWGVGLSTLVLSSFGSIPLDRIFFTGLWPGLQLPVIGPLSSVLLFDLSVLLIVCGAALTFINGIFGEEP